MMIATAYQRRADPSSRPEVAVSAPKTVAPSQPIPARRRVGFAGQVAGVVVMGVVVSGVSFLFATRKVSEDLVPPYQLPAAVVVSASFVDSYSVSQTYSGEMRPQRSARLAFDLGGRVAEVMVEEGAAVTAGQEIATLDTRRMKLEIAAVEADKAHVEAQLAELRTGARPEAVSAAEAAVAQAQSELDHANIERDRVERLRKSRSASGQEWDEVRFRATAKAARVQEARQKLLELKNGPSAARVRVLAAQVASVEARLKVLRADLERSKLKAPFAGTVVRRLRDEGAVVSPGTAIVELMESGAMEAVVGLPPNAVAAISVGSSLEVEIGGKATRGTVTAVLPDVDRITGTTPVILNLEDAGMPYRGERVTVRVPRSVPARGAWLPTKALCRGPRGLWACLTVVADPTTPGEGTLRESLVEVVHTDGPRVLVCGTLESGDRVVVEGLHRFSPGIRVRTGETPATDELCQHDEASVAGTLGFSREIVSELRR